jgi:hypothetical protein
LLKQMTELEKLGKAVQLVEAAKALHQAEELRPRVNAKVIEPFVGPQPERLTSRGCLPRPDQVSDG